MKYFLSLFFVLSLHQIGQAQRISSPHLAFTKELQALKEYFHIPGLVAAVEKDGELIYEAYLGWAEMSEVPIDSASLFPIASLTKMYAAVLLLKLDEENILSLEDPVKKYLPESRFDDSILIKHVLSHTSQGNIGEQFFYSYRFSLLSSIAEVASGESFETLMEYYIFHPLGLQNSHFLKDTPQDVEWVQKMASPYVFNGEIDMGPLERGFSSSAGIVSDVHDLLRFSQALDNNELLKPESKQAMFTPFQPGLPYGYGLFVQELNGLQLLWAYGQYDSYSSLFLKIPSKKLNFVLLANNNLMSDPARLIYGDVSYSMFALACLRFVNGLEPAISLMDSLDLSALIQDQKSFIRHQIMAKAIAESFLSRYDSSYFRKSVASLEHLFEEFPAYESYANLPLLHNLCFLKEVAYHREMGPFEEFDSQIEQIGLMLWEAEPNNPYVNVYLGGYYDKRGEMDKAKKHFGLIRDADNFSNFWYTSVAENWLQSHP